MAAAAPATSEIGAAAAVAVSSAEDEALGLQSFPPILQKICISNFTIPVTTQSLST